MEQIRRKFDKMLFEGQGKQLLWLSVIILSVLFILQFVGWLFWGFKWQDVLALFMDPGNFSHPGGNDFFRIIIALLGVFLFSALLISVFTNIFDNVSSSYRKGESQYSFNNHILIIGSSRPLRNMLSAIRDREEYNGKNILVMTAKDVEKLRSKMNIFLDDSTFSNRITYFHRERNSLNHLKEACAEKACVIYVIGEDNETAHDALNIRCLNLLKGLCGKDGPIIPCYLMMEQSSTLSVFNYLKEEDASRLNIEAINESDYAAEQLMINTSFLPVISRDDVQQRAHIVIVGNSDASHSFASVAAQICHYPNFKDYSNRTKITMVGYGKSDMDRFVASYKDLFNLCHYRYTHQDTILEFHPCQELGDFMDIEWDFIDGEFFSPFVMSFLESAVSNPSETVALAICTESDETNANMALHLPRAVYDSNINIAVCQNDYSELMEAAVSTKKYGNLFIYGRAQQGEDVLLTKRSSMGMRVNRVYDLKYGNPPAKNAEEAWSSLPYAHKYSSIASANSIAMKLKCFHLELTNHNIHGLSEEDAEILSEMEHRRWMTTMLFMGYRSATKVERKDRSRFKELKNEHFVHLDIAPFDELPGEEEKDMLIINNIPYIVTGNQESLVIT